MTYLEDIHPEESAYFKKLRAFAAKKDIPIITLETMRFLRQLLIMKKPKKILELGTAMGFSACFVASVLPGVTITTIERDPAMQALAEATFSASPYEASITLLKEDALDIDTTTTPKPIDFIFIDGAKAQNIKFFEKFEKQLNPNGLIVVDNVLFHDMIDQKIASKNLRQLIGKIDRFNRYITQKQGYDTAIHAIGDGLAVAIKQGE